MSTDRHFVSEWYILVYMNTKDWCVLDYYWTKNRTEAIYNGCWRNIRIYQAGARVTTMVLNTTFKNISVISWRTALLVEETWVPSENYRPVAYISEWSTCFEKQYWWVQKDLLYNSILFHVEFNQKLPCNISR